MQDEKLILDDTCGLSVCSKVIKMGAIKSERNCQTFKFPLELDKLDF